jgi:hypothetical protein
MKASLLKRASAEAKLLLIGIPVAIWTLLPIYHLVLFALSPREQAVSGKLWPDHPTLHNFAIVFKQQHHYLGHFWLQMWNSLLIAVAAGAITLFIATSSAFRACRSGAPREPDSPGCSGDRPPSDAHGELESALEALRRASRAATTRQDVGPWRTGAPGWG